MVGFLLGVAVGVGVSTGIHVGVRGGNIYQVVGWSTLTGGLSAALVRRGFYTGAWAGARGVGAYLGPPAWILLKDIAYVLGQTGKAITRTRSAAAAGRGAGVVARTMGAVGAGYVIGAVVGTGIIYLAEKKGIVYEGATTDVARFYTGGGEYWGDYDWKGKYTGPDPGRPEGIDESGPGIIPDQQRPGYFNVPGNVRIIADHWQHGHYFGH